MSSGRPQQQQQQQTQPTLSTAGSSATTAPQQTRTVTPTTTFGSGEWAIGHNLQITTTTGQIHSGILLIYDPTSQIIVLSSQSRSINGVETPPSNSLVDLQIVNISSIKDIRVLGLKEEGFKSYEAKPITLQDMKNREELAQKRALEEEKRLGVGVSVEGQKIYDAFARTLPVKWVDKSILVAGQALINAPYTIDSVISVTAALNGNAEDNGKSALLARVKHVLQQERARLGMNSVTKGPVEGLRKGG